MSDYTRDNIERYITPVSAGKTAFCMTCDRQRPVWIGETKGGEFLTCCAYCQCVLRRTESQP